MSGLSSRIRELFRLALPIAAAQAGLQLLGVVDTAVVGRLGAMELAAVGLGNTVFFAISIIGMGTVMGVEPLISQAVGANDPAHARQSLWQGSWLAVLVGSIGTIVLLLSPALLFRLDIATEVVAETSTYLMIRAFSLVPMLLFIVARAYLQAFGKTASMVVAMIIANIFNLFADILFVFGGSVLPEWVPLRDTIPAFGVAGAAIATVLGSILQVLILYSAVRRHRIPLERYAVRPLSNEIRQAANVGVPIGLQMGAEVGIFALVGVLAGTLGPVPLAAHQVAIMLASFTFTIAVGIGAAGSVLVGRAIGARQTTAARMSGFLSLAGGGGVMFLSALLFWLLPEPLVRLITTDAEVIRTTAPLLFVAAFFQVFDGLQAVGAGILRGAGDTRFAFIANVIGHWVVGFPIALVLGFRLGLGIVGLWWGLCAGLIAVALVLVVRFDRLTRSDIEPLLRTANGNR